MTKEGRTVRINMWKIMLLILHIEVMDEWFYYVLLLEGSFFFFFLISNKINIAQDAPHLSIVISWPLLPLFPNLAFWEF